MLNQFSEFGNHLGHYRVTGPAFGHVFETVREQFAADGRDLNLAAFTSATGSAGTIAAGDRLKEEYGTKIVAVEALECPTMLENGFGEHNIQGIGDKHIPLIHNVTNTDVVAAISDKATDELDVLFNTDSGTPLPRRSARACPPTSSPRSSTSGSRRSATCSPRSRPPSCSTSAPTTRSSPWPPTAPRSTRASGPRPLATRYGNEFTATDAAEVFGEHLGSVGTDNMIDCTEADRRRIFNLGYYTWVEQQGTPFELFEARRHQDFWRGLRRYVGVWDDMIDDFNARVGGLSGPRRCASPAGGAPCVRREVDIATPFPWRCPNSTTADRHHVLQIVDATTSPDDQVDRGSRDEFRRRSPASRRRTRSSCVTTSTSPGPPTPTPTASTRAAPTPRRSRLDDAVRPVAGVGFGPTPFGRSAALSDALGSPTAAACG